MELNSKDMINLSKNEHGYKLTLSQMTNVRLLQVGRVCRHTISNLMKMAESSPNG